MLPPPTGDNPRLPHIVIETRDNNHDGLYALRALSGAIGVCTAESFEFNNGSRSNDPPYRRLVFNIEGCDPGRCGASALGACGLVGCKVSIVHELGKEVIEVDGRPVQTNPMVTRASAVVLRHSLFNEA